ncbi:MAG: hypothetical protein RL199_1495 [Pseudomonadota bacterium]
MRGYMLFGLTVLLLASAPLRSEGPPLLAVLDFNSPDDAMGEGELVTLTDALRSAVVKEVGARYKVLTRETMREVVPPEKMRCSANMCAADIGRMLQAPFILVGEVRRFSGEPMLTIEAYESNGGRLLGSEQFSGADAKAILGELRGKGQGLVRSWLKQGGQAPATTAAPAREGTVGRVDDFDLGDSDEVVATFDSSPAGAVVLLDGKVLCAATPCSKSVASGRHDVTMSIDQYDDAASTVELSSSKKSMRLDLPPAFALVDVMTEPAGLPVSVDGKVAGTAPLAGLRLKPGAHEVVVKDCCWQELGEQVVVAKGATRRVTLKAVPRYAGLALTAADEKGNDLEAKVEVDGEAKGSTPLKVKLPVCAKEVVVKAADGRTWRQALKLREKAVATLKAVLRRDDNADSEETSAWNQQYSQAENVPDEREPELAIDVPALLSAGKKIT